MINSNLMEKVSNLVLMGQYQKAIFLMDNLTEKGNIFFQMEITILEIGNRD